MDADIDAGWREDRALDRRMATRRRTRRKAHVVINSGWSTLNAQVLNMSVEGALVQLDASLPVPEYFQLRYDGVKRYARRVWMRNRDIGVAFE